MICPKCKSNRTVSVCGKVSDLCSVTIHETGQEHNGYVPKNIGMGSDMDYIEIDYCLNCGFMIGNKFPISQRTVNKGLNDCT